MKAVNKLSLVVAKEFTSTPGSRYKIEGDFSGELFRQSVLKPKLKQAIDENAKLFIDLDGTAGYGTSFLEEAFGGLIRENGYDYQTIIDHIEFKSEEEEYLIEDIYEYLKDAQNEK
jgi:hypothetical protein